MKLHFSSIWILALLAVAVGVRPSPAAEFTPLLDDQLAAVGHNEFVSAIIILESPIDIRALDLRLHDLKATRAERSREVLTALKYNAEMTQPRFKAELDEAREQGRVVGYTAYWIENLFVIKASREFIESMRPRGDVRYATENFKTELIEPIPSEHADDPGRNGNHLDNLTLPPGISAVGAYRVNTELGITGNGVLVANCDTGVDGNHPALSARWRGLIAPWYHCWMDNLGTGTQFPNDGYGHGTHVMGTITGRAISGNDTVWVGCAPRARWIANNAINQGVSSDFDNDIIRTYQWFTNPDSNINTTDDVPDVVQNSWGVYTGLGYPDCFDYWNTVILNCEAAGTVVTWSAGNEGSSGLRSPATYELSSVDIYSVGAVDATNYSPPYPIASFSSRGPSSCPPSPNAIKPEISAPGVDVYSSIPGGGYSGSYSGTSMAGPHVAGIVALMREACPNCDPTTIKTVIMQTAIDYGSVGEDNTYGAGFINGYAAVLAVMGDRGMVTGTIRDANTLLPLPAAVQVVGGTQSTQANASGVYWLSLPGDSTYTLRYSLYGYTGQDIPVTVVTDDTVTQNVNLVPRPVVVAFSEDFESGAPGWTHDTPGGQWIDQWHVSIERSRSATHSYKCGDTGTGTYGNFNDARLTSPVVTNLPAEARLRFWHQIEAEISGTYNDSAYDGGIVEMSINGGAFARVTPVANYNKTFRYMRGGGNPATGPMPGQPCFSGSITTWTEVAVDLAGQEGQAVQVRFRFGSDQAGGLEGWYVDDISISGFGTGELPAPEELVIAVDGPDIVLTWLDDGSPAYRIYQDTSSEGTFDNFVGSTTTNSYRVEDGASSSMLFYVVKAWDGH